MFIRGQAGWTRSPLATQELLPYVPDEADVEDACHQALDPAPDQGWRWTARQAVTGPLGEQQEVDAETDGWAKLWLAKDVLELPADWDDNRDALPTMTSGDLRRAALTFPADTGKGVDNVSPRAFARLSDEVLHYLALVLMCAERLGGWPAVCCFIMVVLLPKPDGGRRPILGSSTAS